MQIIAIPKHVLAGFHEYTFRFQHFPTRINYMLHVGFVVNRLFKHLFEPLKDLNLLRRVRLFKRIHQILEKN